MRVWRISKDIYSNTAFAGDGGLYSAGRWHRKGVRIIYTSSSISLATLEVWVHVELIRRPTSYVLCAATIPDDLPVSSVAMADLPQDWMSKPLHPSVQTIGMNWLSSAETAVLRVPSVVSQGEFNYLLNPAHKNFENIQIEENRPFNFDDRMWKNVPQ